MLLPLASQQSQLNALVAVMAFGLLIGVIGHMTRSRTLIVAGIVIIGGVSVYFGFVVAKVQ